MENTDSYQYNELTEPGAVRLIVLQPCSDLTAPIQCSLITTTLQAYDANHEEGYTALSYVWGDVSLREEIFVDGTRHDITASLGLVLQHVRDHAQTIHMWADALCINQQNIPERNKQVAQMGSIHKIARRTIIFLGLATEISDHLLQAINFPGAVHESGYPTYMNLGHFEVITALTEIIKYPWFRRVWTLQELVLSADPWIQCGGSRCQWSRFRHYIPERTTSHMEDDRQPLRDMSKLRETRLKEIKSNLDGCGTIERQATKLLSILHSRRGLGAQDPKDFIYANLGMSSQQIQNAIPIDYKKSYSALCIEMARQMLLWVPSLDVIQLRGYPIPTSHLNGLPSWVPDWTLPIERIYSLGYDSGGEDESQPRTRPGFPYRLLHDESTLLIISVKSIGTIESFLLSASERRIESRSNILNILTSQSEFPELNPGSLSEEDAQFLETLVYVFGVILENSFGEKEKNIIISTTNKDTSSLSAPLRSIFRGILQRFQRIRSYLPAYRDTDYARENKINKITYAIARIALEHQRPVPSRIAILSSGSITIVSDVARIGDKCFVDLCTDFHTWSGPRYPTVMFVRKDDEFHMTDKDKAALGELVVQPEMEEDGSYMTGPVVTGPFRILARRGNIFTPSTTEWTMEEGAVENKNELILLS